MSHFTKVCQFGKSHGTCKCPSPNKDIIKVPCDRPAEHRPPVRPGWLEELLTEPEPEPKTLRDRFEETFEHFFGGMVVVKAGMLDRLENDVKDWLLSEVNKIV